MVAPAAPSLLTTSLCPPTTTVPLLLHMHATAWRGHRPSASPRSYLALKFEECEKPCGGIRSQEEVLCYMEAGGAGPDVVRKRGCSKGAAQGAARLCSWHQQHCTHRSTAECILPDARRVRSIGPRVTTITREIGHCEGRHYHKKQCHSVHRPVGEALRQQTPPEATRSPLSAAVR
jgi:hypothetical protein